MTEVKSMQKVKVRGQRSRSQRSTPDLAVSGSWLQFEFTYDDEMMHRAGCCLEEVRYCFSRSSVKFQGLKAKNIVDFDPELDVSGLSLQFEFTDGYEMMHKAWSDIKEVPYWFSRSSIKFQGHTGPKNCRFCPNWAFPDWNSSLNSPMA